MKHKEYIIPIGEDALDYDEMFIGVIRRQPELIRCKDCKNWEADENERCMYCGEGILPVTEACMGNGFCSMAEPKEEKR